MRGGEGCLLTLSPAQKQKTHNSQGIIYFLYPHVALLRTQAGDAVRPAGPRVYSSRYILIRRGGASVGRGPAFPFQNDPSRGAIGHSHHEQIRLLPVLTPRERGGWATAATDACCLASSPSYAVWISKNTWVDFSRRAAASAVRVRTARPHWCGRA